MKKLLLYIGIAMATIGCTTDDTTDVVPYSNAVQFTTPNVISRVTTDGKWEGSEYVGISMSGDATATNIQYKAQSSGSSTSFDTSGADKIVYPRTGTVAFSAYCPYQAADSGKEYFTVDMSNQSSGTSTYDLLQGTSDKTGYVDGDEVTFTFAHALTKITFDIGINGDMTSLEGLSVAITKVNNGYTYTPSAGTTSSSATGGVTLYTVVADDKKTATAEMIVYPTDIESTKVVFTVGTEDTRTFEADLAISKIADATIYSYKLDLGAVVTTFGVPTITPWKTEALYSDLINVEDAEAIGSGTETDPFLVYDEADMCAIGGGEYTKNGVAKGDWKLTSHYKLMKDVVLTEAWTPIGSDSSTSFKGSFDGNNKLISGISIIDSSSSYQGLFGYTYQATIKNLSVAGKINSSDNSIGGVVGYSNGSTISNCSSFVEVSGEIYVGGIAGKSIGGTIINCSNSGAVTATSADAGGVVGFISTSCQIINCYNSAKISLTDDSSTSYGIGGVVGYAASSTVNNCYSSGEIDFKVKNYCGGVVGYPGGSPTITSCYYDKTVAEDVGGAIGVSSSDGADTAGSAEGVTTEYLKSSSMLSVLNNNAVDIEDAFGWYTGTSGYPEFDPSGATPAAKSYDLEYDDSLYLIYTDKGLQAFADLVNGYENTAGAYCSLAEGVAFNSGTTKYNTINGKLVNDIDISLMCSSNWTPIGDYVDYNSYKGTFDGDNKLVSGLKINTSGGSFIGLFGTISGAEIKNLGVSGSVTNTNVTSNGYTAGVVGYSNNSTVTNCYNLCEVSGDSRDGGVVGSCIKTTISDCYNNATVTSSGYAGGVVGYSSSTDSTPSVVVNCYNRGEVKSDTRCGGVAGTNYGNAIVVNCYNHGAVSANGSGYAGGVVGYNAAYNTYYGAVYNCYNTAAVSGGTYNGGVVGGNEASCTITDCYWINVDGGDATTAVGADSNSGSTTTADEMTSSAMKAGSFVTALNNGAYTYNLTATVPAHGWETVEGDYPVFSSVTPQATTPDIELENGVYLIHTAAGLQAFSALVNGVEYTDVVAGAGVEFSGTPLSNINGELTNSIDLSGIESWTAIGTDSYAGTFDGCGYTITSLSATGGLFTNNYGTIVNLGVGGTITGSASSLGGLADFNEGKIINCYSSVDITVSNSGGVVGNNSGIVTNCYYSGTLSGTNVGGVVYSNSVSGTVSYCYYDTTENSSISVIYEILSSYTTYNNSGKTTEELKSETMLKILNNGAYYANNASYDVNALAWHTGSDGYPTFTPNSTPTETIDIELDNGTHYIYTVEGLQAFADLTNGVVNSTAITKGDIEFSSSPILNINGELTKSLDISDMEWTPICGADISDLYTGEFDGKGFEVSGMSVTSGENVGLFGQNSGTIKNLSVSGSVSGATAGGVVGLNQAGTILNCCSSVIVEGSEHSGGITGWSGGKVYNCYNWGAVSGAGENGGVVGYSKGELSNCYNTAVVSGGNINGGVVGLNNGTVTNGYFDNTINSSLSAIGDDDNNISSSITVAMSTTAMINESFVKMLNNGAYDINGACEWVQVSHHYPVFNYSGTPSYTTPDISLVSGVYEINTAEGLNAFGYLVNGAVLNTVVTSGGVNFSTTGQPDIDGELMKDVDLSTVCSATLGTQWSPIGNVNNYYNGEFNGNGHEVKSIYINAAGSKRGLFGYTNTNAVIWNLGVSGDITSTVSGGTGYETGGLVAVNYGLILNCYNLVNVTGDWNVGGLVGWNTSTGTVANSYNRGTMTGSGSAQNIGGMVGKNDGTISFGYSDGAVTGTTNVGGVAGVNSVDTVSGCYYINAPYVFGNGTATTNLLTVNEENNYYYSGSNQLLSILQDAAGVTYSSSYTSCTWQAVDGESYPALDFGN